MNNTLFNKLSKKNYCSYCPDCRFAKSSFPSGCPLCENCKITGTESVYAHIDTRRILDTYMVMK